MLKILNINNVEFAQKQQNLADSFDVLSFTRLLETLAINDKNIPQAHINFALSGDFKRFRQPSLHLHITAKLPVICQRCLDAMWVQSDLKFDYLISNTDIENNDQNIDQNDEIDWVAAETEMNIQELIEDELLLAMPIAPMHDHDCSKLSKESGEKPNPFAVLKSLKL
jgi:uncharacterized protein